MCKDDKHKLVHLDTKKYQESQGYYSKWTKIDRFFCEKCGEIFVKKTEECQREVPDWY